MFTLTTPATVCLAAEQLLPGQMPLGSCCESTVFQERLREARALDLAVPKSDSNCMGFALYMLGLLALEAYVDPTEAFNRASPQLTQIPAPVPGCLVVSFLRNSCTEVSHAAIVVEADPLRVLQRAGFGEPVERQLLKQAFNRKNEAKEFYRLR